MSRRSPAQRQRTHLRHQGWAAGNPRPLDIRSGDTVIVLAGRDRGRRGTVDRVLIGDQRVVVRGVNTLKRHTRAGVRGNIQGGIVDFDAPIHYSNVMLVCNRCDKPTRIAHTLDADGHRVVVCKKCGELYQRVRD
jgi:large subunit ribosomal protein L24